MKNAIILFSGGLDSTTCLAYAKSKEFNCYALSFNYDQRHSIELSAAKKIAEFFNVPHIIVNLPIAQFGQSALTDLTLDVPEYKDNQSIPITYVPARNTIFLSFAIAWAEVLKVNDIFIGVSSVDYSHYPDCREDYIKAFEVVANLATKSAREGESIQLHAPLMFLSKAQTIQLGMSLGVDYKMTISCYKASSSGEACGTCDSCILRKKGFQTAKVKDPTLYLV